MFLFQTESICIPRLPYVVHCPVTGVYVVPMYFGKPRRLATYCLMEPDMIYLCAADIIRWRIPQPSSSRITWRPYTLSDLMKSSLRCVRLFRNLNEKWYSRQAPCPLGYNGKEAEDSGGVLLSFQGTRTHCGIAQCLAS